MENSINFFIFTCLVLGISGDDLMNCNNVTAPSDVTLSKLNGTWYIQKYTAPPQAELQTKCDVLVFNISNNLGSVNTATGYINYTYVIIKDDRSVSQEANITVLGGIGKYQYEIKLGSNVVKMLTTIAALQDDVGFVHMACDADKDGGGTVVVATKAKDATNDTINTLIKLAAQQGANVSNLKPVDQRNCTIDATNGEVV